MCGRFALARPIAEIAKEVQSEYLPDYTPFEPSWNVAPQQWIPVITQTGVNNEANVSRHMRLMRWGFRPSWAQSSTREPINARSETAHEKPMFRNAWMKRRGVVPADGWYEWMKTPQGKIPWYHYNVNGSTSYMAVIWESWNHDGSSMESFSILTTPANEDCKEVHTRMPVLIQPTDFNDWFAGKTMMNPLPSGRIDLHPVSPKVNDSSNNGQDLTHPIPRLFD